MGGDFGRSRPLLLHARVLGPDRQLPHRLPVHRLVDHRPLADGGVLLDPLRGEAGILEAWLGFFVGLAGWGYILFEIFSGEAGQVASSGDKVSEHVKASFSTMRFIVTAGWSISPLGYFLGYLTGAVSEAPLNLVYNLADFVNKIAFCLATWQSAKRDTAERGH